MKPSNGLRKANEIIRLSTVDSSNNYAMAAIDDDRAAHGYTVVAERQSAGRGQRGHSWFSGENGESLLMSVVLQPKHGLDEQPLFSAAVSVAIAKSLNSVSPLLDVQIKWPNDIILGDKKAGGILIENVIRGSQWTWAVIGLGLNVHQESMPAYLMNATSLALHCGVRFSKEEVLQAIQTALVNLEVSSSSLEEYNGLLYRRGEFQNIHSSDGRYEVRILEMLPSGALLVEHQDGTTHAYRHGSVEWIWPFAIEI